MQLYTTRIFHFVIFFKVVYPNWSGWCQRQFSTGQHRPHCSFLLVDINHCTFLLVDFNQERCSCWRQRHFSWPHVDRLHFFSWSTSTSNFAALFITPKNIPNTHGILLWSLQSRATHNDDIKIWPFVYPFLKINLLYVKYQKTEIKQNIKLFLGGAFGSVLNLVSGRTRPMDVTKVRTQSGRTYYSFLSIGWGFLADCDIESERLRYISSNWL